MSKEEITEDLESRLTTLIKESERLLNDVNSKAQAFENKFKEIKALQSECMQCKLMPSLNKMTSSVIKKEKHSVPKALLQLEYTPKGNSNTSLYSTPQSMFLINDVQHNFTNSTSNVKYIAPRKSYPQEQTIDKMMSSEPSSNLTLQGNKQVYPTQIALSIGNIEYVGSQRRKLPTSMAQETKYYQCQNSKIPDFVIPSLKTSFRPKCNESGLRCNLKSNCLVSNRARITSPKNGQTAAKMKMPMTKTMTRRKISLIPYKLTDSFKRSAAKMTVVTHTSTQVPNKMNKKQLSKRRKGLIKHKVGSSFLNKVSKSEEYKSDSSTEPSDRSVINTLRSTNNAFETPNHTPSRTRLTHYDHRQTLPPDSSTEVLSLVGLPPIPMFEGGLCMYEPGKFFIKPRYQR